jgi:hypothetical protein
MLIMDDFLLLDFSADLPICRSLPADQALDRFAAHPFDLD